MKIFVGIDVSSFDMKVCIMNSDGEVLNKLTSQNNLHGAKSISNEITNLAKVNKVKEIQIGMESTSVYSWHPDIFFNEDEAPKDFNTKVYTINPKLIKKFKDAYVVLDKTDDIDALIIANRLRFGRLPLSINKTEQYMALQRHTKMRFRLVQNLTREKQYFLQNLFLSAVHSPQKLKLQPLTVQ